MLKDKKIETAIDILEEKYFKEIYVGHSKFYFTKDFVKYKEVVNSIFKDLDGRVYDLYGHTFGKRLYDNVLCESSRRKYLSCGKVESYHSGINRLKQFLFIDKGQGVKYLLLYKDGIDKKTYALSLMTRVLNRLRVINLCDEIEKRGLEGDRFVTLIMEGFSYKDIHRDIELYEKAEKVKDTAGMFSAGINLYADYFYIRDFPNAYEWYLKLRDMGIDADFSAAHTELWKRLWLIFDEWEKRNQKNSNISMIWIDGLRYNDLQYMPRTKNIMEEGLYFEQMYTPCVFTHPVIRTLFDGKLLIDDKSYEIRESDLLDDSPLAVTLKENGYTYLNISPYLFKDLPMDDGINKYMSPAYPAMAAILFYAISKMDAEKNKFMLIHCMEEVHGRYISPIFPDRIPIPDEDDAEIVDKNIREQLVASLCYADQVLAFYHRFFRTNRYQIYMSDHGSDNWIRDFSFEKLHHICFSIRGGNRQKHIKAVIGLNKFPEIIKKLLAEEAIDEIPEGFAYIQREDEYGNVILQKRIKDQRLQYRGIVTEEDRYVRIVNGKEYYYRKKDELENEIDNKIYQNRIMELRLRAGNRYIDIYQGDRWSYTRKTYKVHKLKRAEDIEYF